MTRPAAAGIGQDAAGVAQHDGLLDVGFPASERTAAAPGGDGGRRVAVKDELTGTSRSSPVNGDGGVGGCYSCTGQRYPTASARQVDLQALDHLAGQRRTPAHRPGAPSRGGRLRRGAERAQPAASVTTTHRGRRCRSAGPTRGQPGSA